jgi:hypothetical protein
MTSQREKRVISYPGGKVPLLFMPDRQWFEFTRSSKIPAIMAEIGKFQVFFVSSVSVQSACLAVAHLGSSILCRFLVTDWEREYLSLYG